MIAIPNMKKPSCCALCLFVSFTLSESYCDLLDKEIGEADMLTNCPLIEIAEPTETLIHDIRKLIAFIEPRMIIASTYAEQIERAEAVKNWLLSIVGEFNATQHTQSVESVEQEEWIDW